MNTEANKSIIHIYASMWNEHRTDLAAQILADDYIDHAHPEAKGPQAIARVVDMTLKAVPDFHIALDLIIAEGDLVAFREVITMSAEGKPLKLEGMSFARITNGKIAERWAYYDQSA